MIEMATAEIIGIGTGIIVDLGIGTGVIGKMKRLILSLCLLLLFMGVSSGSNTTGNLGVSYGQLMADMEGFFPDMKFDTTHPPPYFEGKIQDKDNRQINAQYNINIESESSKEKMESWGVSSVRLHVRITKDFSDKKNLPYIMMLQTCLRNAFPEWKDDEERNEWLTETIESLIKGANPQYSDITNTTRSERVVGNKKIIVWITGGIISLEIYAL